MCPMKGLALLNFSIVQAANIALVYTIGSYCPIAKEVTLTTLTFKCICYSDHNCYSPTCRRCFRFPPILLYEFMDRRIRLSECLRCNGRDIFCCSVVLGCALRLGKRIRHATWNWRLISYVHWDEDREVWEWAFWFERTRLGILTSCSMRWTIPIVTRGRRPIKFQCPASRALG